ncbi:BQ2448_4524 [Microbotryum intermedium]|uniref:BQ2448_4524 protein n=1 Tax=Microbotryum intermedium TaxID=269621 RepID=A0A238FDB6_9BASI|nr:BQ2448_4524 [Microbotryum intermedium]
MVKSHHPKRNTSALWTLPTVGLLWCCAVVAPATRVAASSAASSGEVKVAPNFSSPPLHYSPLSFRGLTPDYKIKTFDMSGHTTPLPAVHDFLRLTPSFPLAHGAIYTTKPLESEQWVVEVAFRVHGVPAVGLVETLADGTTKRMNKDQMCSTTKGPLQGGRGLAFWFTKEGLPGPVTISADPKKKTHDPPHTLPIASEGSTDESCSLFGSRTSFEGLGIIFDTSPAAPLYRRTQIKNLASSMSYGVGMTGVVSGIMDDGHGGWLDADSRDIKQDEEAGYLEKAFGECEASFRNAQGLLWARISYLNHTVRVDLDLAPHTTLEKAGRDYAHNCFHMEGVKLPPKGYLGISGLAGGNSEPDAIDIYAVDIFTVTPGEEANPNKPIVDDSPVIKDIHHVLEGTSNDAEMTLVAEIFMSQSKMIEAIDALTRRFDLLAQGIGRFTGIPKGSGGTSKEAGTLDTAAVDSRLQRIESQLRLLSTSRHIGASSPGNGGSQSSSPKDETLALMMQQQEKVLVELAALERKLETSSVSTESHLPKHLRPQLNPVPVPALQNAATVSVSALSSRNYEILQLLHTVADTIEAVEKRAQKIPLWTWASGLVVVVGGVWHFVKKRNNAVWDERKYL